VDAHAAQEEGIREKGVSRRLDREGER